MLSLDPASTASSPLVFTDARLECSSVISALLGLLYDHELPSIYDPASMQDLVDLADKWEIELVNKAVRKQLAAFIHLESASPSDIFLIAIKLNAINLAARTIEMGTWDYVVAVLIGTDDADLIDIQTFAFDCFESDNFARMPPKAAWALQRAAMMWDHGLGTGTKSKDEDSRRRQVIAENFRRIMDPSCTSSVPVVQT
jgi:hypothetical protein